MPDDEFRDELWSMFGVQPETSAQGQAQLAAAEDLVHTLIKQEH